MKNRTKSHLADLTEQLNNATEQLVKVVHRLDEFEAHVSDMQHVSTIHPGDFGKPVDENEDKLEHKSFNPEAGP